MNKYCGFIGASLIGLLIGTIGGIAFVDLMIDGIPKCSPASVELKINGNSYLVREATSKPERYAP